MPNPEMQERTADVLAKVAQYLTNDELALLCWHCGLSWDDITPSEPTATQKVIPIAEL